MWLSGETNSTFIFSGWDTNNPKELILAIVTTVVMCLLYEGIRAVVQLRERAWTRRSLENPNTFPMALQHCILSGAYSIQVILVCFLGLSVLTYNIWILITIGLSSGLGFLVLRPTVTYCMTRYQGHYNLQDIEQQPLFYETSSTPEKVRHSCALSRPNLHISNITIESDERWNQLRQMYRHASESRHFLQELRRRHPSIDSTIDFTYHSANSGLRWQYEDQMGGFNETFSSADNWIQEASWDATLDMLESGYIGRVGSPCSVTDTPSRSLHVVKPEVLPLYVTVV